MNLLALNRKITDFLTKTKPSIFNAYCILAAFSTYFCMYAFRKPFSVGTYTGVELGFLGEIDYKVVLIIAQVLGYTLSKFLGIKIVSEASGNKRGRTIIGFILMAELSLLGFALAPPAYKIFFIFLNGVPLGMIWGLVFSYLEGRKSTELLGAGMSASYIIASGFVKTVGKIVLSWGVSEFWMPVVTGLLFAPFFLFFVFLLRAIPRPTEEDIRLRTKRVAMGAEDRWLFFKTFAPGLVPLTLLYMLLTAYRDFRDNFAREIWDAVGFSGEPMVFTTSEIPIAFGVLIALAFLMFIKNNKKALLAVHLIMMAGSAMVGLSTLAYQAALISPLTWMISIGLGLYLAYVPYGCVLFDRLIAATGFIGTAGFMIYVTDAFGYLGSVGLMLYKNLGHPNLSWLNFFFGFSYVTSIVCTGSFLVSLAYFWKYRRSEIEKDKEVGGHIQHLEPETRG